MGSVGIHDNVGIVGIGPNDKLHKENARPAVVASRLVHACRGKVVAQEVDGLAVLPGDGTQTFPAPEFVAAMFGQPLADFLGVVLAAWHVGACGQDSQFVLQQVEERDRVVKAVHEQHVVLIGKLRVLH